MSGALATVVQVLSRQRPTFVVLDQEGEVLFEPCRLGGALRAAAVLASVTPGIPWYAPRRTGPRRYTFVRVDDDDRVDGARMLGTDQPWTDGGGR